MTEEVRNKMRAIYDSLTEKARNVIGVFVDQFDEIYVDNDLPTFDMFMETLREETLGSLGIHHFSDSNDYGSYTIDIEDYKLNGKGKEFLEYIPDLGIIDYLLPTFMTKLHYLQEIVHPDFNGVWVTIRFPKVTVTNEYNKSIDITELYVRVSVTFQGTTKGTFTMNRAEYTPIQWVDDYAHSHLPGINRTRLEVFGAPCTGTGPVNRTIATLSSSYDLNIWGLYAFEIAKYVTVESIAGVPYRRLENVGKSDSVECTPSIPMSHFLSSYNNVYSIQELKEFVKEFIMNDPIAIAYRQGNFILGEDFVDFWIRLSNAFIKWHNRNVTEGGKTVTLDSLLHSSLLNKYVVAGGIVYSPNVAVRMNQVSAYEGRELFMFKGNMVRLHFTGTREGDSNITYLVDKGLCFYVLTKVLEIISYNYGRTEKREEESSTPVNSRCYYA